jgi:hypothetical protein
VSVNSVNIVHSVNKVVNSHKDNYHYVGGVPHNRNVIRNVLNSHYLACLDVLNSHYLACLDVAETAMGMSVHAQDERGSAYVKAVDE